MVRVKNKKEEDKEDGETSSDEEVEDGEMKEEESDGEVEESSLGHSEDNSLQKLFIAHGSIEDIGWNQTKAISLTHPRTKMEALFLINFGGNDKNGNGSKKSPFVYEILTMAADLRSWFVKESVISNGNIYTFTPMDPLFFIVPILSMTTKAMPFRDHLTEAFSPDVAKIFYNRVSSKQLQNIAIRKVSGDIEAFAYSEEATLNWLAKKVKKASQYLSQKGINGSEVSVSVNFKKSSSATLGNGEEDEEIKVEFLQYACHIVGDYIDDALKRKLLTKFGLPIEPERSKRKNNDDVAGEDETKKKLKVTDNVQPLEDYGSNSPAANASKIGGKGRAKEKELQKAAQGTRSLLSFFAAKPK